MLRSLRSREGIRLLVAATLLASGSPSLEATSYLITTTADGAVNNGNCTLREALRAADTNAVVDACPAGSAADAITLPNGTYPFAGGELLTGSGSLAIQSQSLDPFAVTIDLSSAGRFLRLQGAGVYALSGLGIINGAAPPAELLGGAIHAEQVGLQISKFRFVSNTAPSAGGALYYASSDASSGLAVEDGTFGANHVTGVGAAAVFGGAAFVAMQGGADAGFRDVAFVGNSATSGAFAVQGGALHLQTNLGGLASCIRCDFDGNSAVSNASSGTSRADGGAVYISNATGSRTRLLDGRFTGNSATAASSATKVAVLSAFTTSGGTLELERLFVDFNGGGPVIDEHDVWLENRDSTSLTTFYDSQMTFGSSNGLVIITDSGATLGHLTIADYPGAGITYFAGISAGFLSMHNSIAVFNGTNLNPIILSAPLLQTTNFVGGDPLFVDRPAGDYRLMAASPAIDDGTNVLPSVRPFDLDHHTRVVGGITDIGCYEFDGLFADDFEVGDAGSWSAVVP